MRAVTHHQEFFAGMRDILIKTSFPVRSEGLQSAVDYDTMDWDTQFDKYVRIGVENAKVHASRRLEMDVDDDYIPIYMPYFGGSIHHSFFGGQVRVHAGTSYADPVINRAADWQNLRPDMNNVWISRLAGALAYCRDHGDGVLIASFRGANGPLDMANGVLGNALFTECLDDPENMHKVMDVCTDAVSKTFALQAENCTRIDGGHVVPMGNIWLPEPMIGHISLDAVCLAGPAIFNEFEVPYLKRLADKYLGMYVHTHMLGHKSFPTICKAPGFVVFAPANDPKQPTLLEKFDKVLDAAGDIPLHLEVPAERLGQILTRLRGRRAIICVNAADADEARRIVDRVR